MHALWIGPYEATVAPPGERPAYWLRREFGLASVGRAQVQIAVRGLVEVFVNGTRVGDELLPGYTQYDLRLPVRTFDFSDYLRTGRTRSCCVLADGWFRGQTGAVRAADQLGTSTSVAAHLVVDGDVAVATDGSWRSAPSHVLTADLIAGQIGGSPAVRRRGPATGPRRRDWQHRGRARSADCCAGRVRRPPVRRGRGAGARLGDRAPTQGPHRRPRAEHQRLDPAVRPRPGGHRITLIHGEWLDADGDVTTEHLRVDFPFLPDRCRPVRSTKSCRPASRRRLRAAADDARLPVRPHRGPSRTARPRRRTRGRGPHRSARGPAGSPAATSGSTGCTRRRSGASATTPATSRPTARTASAPAGSATGSSSSRPPPSCTTSPASRKWLRDVPPPSGRRHDRQHRPVAPAEGGQDPIAGLNGSAGWEDAVVVSVGALRGVRRPRPRWPRLGRDGGMDRRKGADGARRPVTGPGGESGPQPAPHERFLWDTGFHWGEWLEPGRDRGLRCIRRRRQGRRRDGLPPSLGGD